MLKLKNLLSASVDEEKYDLSSMYLSTYDVTVYTIQIDRCEI
jgi:hypothetical protein